VRSTSHVLQIGIKSLQSSGISGVHMVTLMPSHLFAGSTTSLPRSRQLLRYHCTAVQKNVLTLQPPPLPSTFHVEDIYCGDDTIIGLIPSSSSPSWFSLLKKSKNSLNCSWYKILVSQERIMLQGTRKSLD
jgi:hypothetical protein